MGAQDTPLRPVRVYDEGRTWNAGVAAAGGQLDQWDYTINTNIPEGPVESLRQAEQMIPTQWLRLMVDHPHAMVIARPFMCSRSTRMSHPSYKAAFALWQRFWVFSKRGSVLPPCTICGDQTAGCCPQIRNRDVPHGRIRQAVCGFPLCKDCQVEGPKKCRQCRGQTAWPLPVHNLGQHVFAM